jgi:hypothetical protein
MQNRAWVVVAGGLLVTLVFMAAVWSPQTQTLHSALAASQRDVAPSDPMQVSTPVMTQPCYVIITTTSSLLTNFSFDTPAQLAGLNTGLALFSGTIPPFTYAVPQDQWFQLTNVTVGDVYNFIASPDNDGYNLGMEIYSGTVSSSAQVIGSNVDTQDTSASISGLRFNSQGTYRVRIFQAASQCSGGTYRLSYSHTPPTNTPTMTPSPTRTPTPITTATLTPTPYAGAPSVDVFEPNNNFDQATTIGLNVKYDKLNFVQWDINSSEWDNDFFKVRVKPGMLVTCHTLQLTPGTDTNLILYDNNLNGINGSDDVNRAGGDLSSSVTYFVTYEGWLYSLVGEGFARPRSEQAGTGYSFECTIATQTTPTPLPTATDAPDAPTRTPTPIIPTETPIPSPTLTPTPPFIGVKPLPTATPPGLPLQQVPVGLLTYYDVNGNNKYDPGEGIVGISARVIDLTTGKLLAQGLTDTTGRVSFTVSAPGAVQLVVPFLNRSEIILPSGKAVTIRVSPSALPSAIP